MENSLTPEEIEEINKKINEEPSVTLDLQKSQDKSVQESNSVKPAVFDMQSVNIQTQEFANQALEERKDEIKDKVDTLVEKQIQVEFEKTMLELKEKDKLNQIFEQKIKNELLESKNKAVLLKKQGRHDKRMQKLQHRKEFNAGFIERNGLNGDENFFSWYWFKIIDFLKQTMIKTIEVSGLANKLVRRVLFYILIAIFVFVEPVRTFIIGLIGG